MSILVIVSRESRSQSVGAVTVLLFFGFVRTKDIRCGIANRGNGIRFGGLFRTNNTRVLHVPIILMKNTNRIRLWTSYIFILTRVWFIRFKKTVNSVGVLWDYFVLTYEIADSRLIN